MTLVSENDLRQRLGLAPLPEPYMIAPCPTCGGVHIAGDCGGRPVIAVVTLAPGEVVTQRNGHAAQRERAPRVGIGGLKPETRAKLDARRKAKGWTWDEYLDVLEGLDEAFDEPA